MPSFSAWDIVKVPFPYTDRPVRQRRPALVVTGKGGDLWHGLLWAVMITSRENRIWPEDVIISDLEAAGLPAPSMVRTTKIATIEAKEAEKIGVLPASDRQKVAANILSVLELDVDRDHHRAG